jgi:hypothetical protein
MKFSTLLAFADNGLDGGGSLLLASSEVSSP